MMPENVSPISLTKKTSVYFVVLSVFIYLIQDLEVHGQYLR